jgi:hypothetical protein
MGSRCVNQVGYQATIMTDKSKPLTANNIRMATQQIIPSAWETVRDTHLKNIETALYDARVRAVIEPMIAGLEVNL